MACAATLAEAWDLAFRCDPVSPFGGIVALNRPLDLPAAEKIAAILTEVIIAPDADEAAKARSRAARTCACCSPAACRSRSLLA